MKNKQILIALIVFFVLFVIYFTALRKPEKSTVVVGYQPVSKEFSAKNVRKIELYKGNDKKDGVILQKGTNDWVVENSFQAPAHYDKVQRLLDALGDIEGKIRATGKEFFRDFHLSEEKALHIIFTGEGALPHILIGKRGEDNMSTFVRLADKDDILIVDKDLYREMEMWGDTVPKVDDWIQKQFLNLDKELIREITYHRNGKDFLFTMQEKESEEKGEHEAHKNEDIKKEHEWKLTSWDKVFEPHESKISDIVSAASSLWIEKAVDPEVYNEDYFKHTDTTVTISTSDNRKYTVHLADKDGSSYVKKDGTSNVYKILTYERKRLFPDMGEFLKIELPKIKELEGHEVLDYRVDPDWAGKQIVSRKLEETDKTVKISYDREDDKTWIRFDNNNTVFAFDKKLSEELSSEKNENENENGTEHQE
ncbi:MAG: DUF4340 domain-containing protein [wastewater metagenome]|nr:DUF4340 domain-containing protein [Candidatus Loosdrechtia aerotolerans]